MLYPIRDLVNYSNLLKKCFLRTTNCLPQRMKQNSLFALSDWKCRRYMHAPTTASSTEASTRIWMHAPCAVHCVTKSEKDDPRDVEGERPRKRVPAKVMWYSPIIPCLKRLFRNKENAKLMRWHKEERKKDSMLRHPADGS